MTTSADSDLVRLPHEVPISSAVVDIDGVPMSAKLAEAADPRAVIVAIHGGVTTAPAIPGCRCFAPRPRSASP